MTPDPEDTTRTLVACEGPRGGVWVLPVTGGTADLLSCAFLKGATRRFLALLQEGADDARLTQALLEDGAADRESAARDVARLQRELRALGAKESGGRTRAADTQDRPAAGAEARTEDVEVGAADLERIARRSLAEGIRLRFRALGRSMRPLLPDGVVLEVAPRPFGEVRRGEVVLYRTEPLRLVAHRVVSVDAERLVTRGDGAARRDVVARDDYLGVVESGTLPSGRRIDVSSGWRRIVGLAAGRGHELARGAGRVLVLRPLRRSYAGRSALRSFLGGSARLASRGLFALERLARAARRPVDAAAAGLTTTAEKDAERDRLYRRFSVQEFTALAENLSAGLTLLEEVVLARHPLRPQEGSEKPRILVVGCGPGRECMALARRGMQVVGLDREAAMLERARTAASAEGLEIGFAEGEAHDFRLEGEPFDGVLVFSGLYNMILPRSRRVATLARAREHLRPGGRVVLTFLSAYTHSGEEAAPRRRSFWSQVHSEHEDGDTFLTNEVVHVFPRGRDVSDEAEEAGLEVVDVVRDQRAYDRFQGTVKGYAVLRRPGRPAPARENPEETLPGAPMRGEDSSR